MKEEFLTDIEVDGMEKISVIGYKVGLITGVNSLNNIIIFGYCLFLEENS